MPFLGLKKDLVKFALTKMSIFRGVILMTGSYSDSTLHIENWSRMNDNN